MQLKELEVFNPAPVSGHFFLFESVFMQTAGVLMAQANGSKDEQILTAAFKHRFLGLY